MILAINIHRLTVSQWVMVLYLEQKLLSNEEHLLVWSKIDSKGIRFVLVRYVERYHIWDKAESEWLRLFCIVKRKVKITNILPTNVCWVWFVANLWLDSVWLKFRFCSVIYWFGAKGWNRERKYGIALVLLPRSFDLEVNLTLGSCLKLVRFGWVSWCSELRARYEGLCLKRTWNKLGVIW